jgi:hypothetical protein
MAISDQKPPSLRIERLREWLARNKVFFETVSASALAFAAVVVSIIQLREGHLQNELMSWQNKMIEMQTRVQEAQALPIFDIKIEQQTDGDAGKVKRELLTISNSGGPASEVAEQTAFQIDIVTDYDWTLSTVKRSITVSDYYAKPILDRETKGLLATFDASSNRNLITAFENAIPNGTHDVTQSVRVTDATVLEIDYSDILGRVHTKYFKAV